MQTSIVSIMMPAYNAERYVGLAIESVLAQTYPHWELIIVNDGSTDRTPEIAGSYSDPRIKVIHQPNGGEASARNTALRYMQGDLVAFLDADDLYLPNHLEVTIAFLQAHTNFDGVYTDGYYCNQDGVRLKTLSSRRRGPFQGDIFEEVIRSSDVFGAPVCVVLRRHIISTYRMEFDPEIIIGPDWDFLARYSEVASFGTVNQQTCLYRIHQTNISLRTNIQKRSLNLARCREKAIKMNRFGSCTVETRAFMFFDLLINLLPDFPERQAAITKWSEFTELPAENQARLFRLMASKALLRDVEHTYIKQWLRNSKELNPSDIRSTILNTIYFLNPQICKYLLKVKAKAQSASPSISPFENLLKAKQG
jgi:glycosyltransferase involved in cell wall biosynthesis